MSPRIVENMAVRVVFLSSLLLAGCNTVSIELDGGSSPSGADAEPTDLEMGPELPDGSDIPDLGLDGPERPDLGPPDLGIDLCTEAPVVCPERPVVERTMIDADIELSFPPQIAGGGEMFGVVMVETNETVRIRTYRPNATFQGRLFAAALNGPILPPLLGISEEPEAFVVLSPRLGILGEAVWSFDGPFVSNDIPLDSSLQPRAVSIAGDRLHLTGSTLGGSSFLVSGTVGQGLDRRSLRTVLPTSMARGHVLVDTEGVDYLAAIEELGPLGTQLVFNRVNFGSNLTSGFDVFGVCTPESFDVVALDAERMAAVLDCGSETRLEILSQRMSQRRSVVVSSGVVWAPSRIAYDGQTIGVLVGREGTLVAQLRGFDLEGELRYGPVNLQPATMSTPTALDLAVLPGCETGQASRYGAVMLTRDSEAQTSGRAEILTVDGCRPDP